MFHFLILAALLSVGMSCRGEESKELSNKPKQQATAPNIPLVPPHAPEKMDPKATSFETLMQTPIEFYGVVLDQDGNPVAGATVSGSVLDSLKGSPISVKTGGDGRFTLIFKGTALSLTAGKRGYYQVEKGRSLRPSEQGFDFGFEDSPRAYQPDPNSPVMFHLRKAGNPIVLDRLMANPSVPRDGTPISISPSKTSSVSFQVKCRTSDDSPKSKASFDWHCEIVVNEGGIQEVVGDHVFVAPETGYSTSAVIDMTKTLGPKQWSSRVRKNYWIRFSDHTFGKISFKMHAGGDHFAVIEGFRNPSPNDRNLEPKLDSR